MKQFLLLFIALVISGSLLSQNVPVAVDDYVDVSLGDIVTVNVTENDYHPDSLSFSIFMAGGAVSYTDSTITYNINYELYYNRTDTIKFNYVIKDENGNYNPEFSRAIVFITIKNNNYYDFLGLNNIRAKVQASGLQFWRGPSTMDYDTSYFEFPKGSGKNTVFSSSLWVGGNDGSGVLKLAAERYRQVGLDYWTGPLSIDGNNLSMDTATVIKWQNVWKLTKEEVIYHKFHWWETAYEPIEDIATWPAHGDVELNQAEYLAPFIDVNGDSIYDPMVGDYPLIRGDQCIYFIINDLRQHTETGGEALGLEIHGMAYEFYNSETEAMNNTVFFSYKIFNRSSNTYYDTYIGLFTDIDLGDAWDDYIGCDVARGTYYCYNGDSIDGNGSGEPYAYGDFIPAQGIVTLGGPLMDANGEDDPTGQCDESINGVGFGDGIEDNERYGMNKFLYMINSNGGQADPQTADEYYGYLKGIWKDGTVMEYGGNGHVSSGAYGPAANFMFPGLTDSCFWGTGGEEPYGPIDWTETSTGNEPGDRRGLNVMGPFTFEPGSMERVDIAYIGAFPKDEITAVENLMNYIDTIRNEYHKDPTYFGYQWLGIEENKIETAKNKLIAYPNPVTNNLTFIYEGAANDASYKLSNIMGKIIFTGNIIKDEPLTINLTKLTSGIYVLTVIDTKMIYSTKVIKK